MIDEYRVGAVCQVYGVTRAIKLIFNSPHNHTQLCVHRCGYDLTIGRSKLKLLHRLNKQHLFYTHQS